jgi:hypothetical protein
MPMPQRDTSTRKITNLLNIVKTSIKNIKDGFAPGLPQPKPQAIPNISPQPAPSGTSGGDLDLFGIKCIYKSKPDGRVVTNPDIRFFTRRYRSGKANVPTVECTLDPKTPITNQECTAIIKMNGMIHPDTIDWKMRGGRHSSDNGGKDGTCYSLEIMSDGSQGKYLEVERPHPSMHSCTKFCKPLFKLPDISNAKFGWKGIVINSADNKSVHIESWVNLTPDDQSKWQKYIDVIDIGQLPQGLILQCMGPRATIRIDGIKGHPEFTNVSMREITL